jgi:glycosyltransferase involved in cell wall biosynthesis
MNPRTTQLAIDLIIPAFNEQANIKPLFEALAHNRLRHIVVVDNGSTDATAELARQAGAIVVREPQRGYGAACLAGIACLKEHAASRNPPDVVAFLDADLSDDPGHLAAVCEPLVRGEADMVIGSRVRLAQQGALTPPQRCGNALAVTLIRWCTGTRYSDLGPMRAIRWASLQELNMADRTWGWTVEMQYKAATAGLAVSEVDVPYHHRHAGTSKISGSIVGSARAGWKILSTIAALWWRSPRKR